MDPVAAAPDAGRQSIRRATRRVARAGRVVAATTSLAVLAAGCAAGQIAQTADEKSSIDGTNVSVGDIALRGVAIDAPIPGQTSYPSGSAVTMRLVLVNNARTADRLVGITSSAFRGWGAFASSTQAYRVQAAATASPTESSESSSEPPSGSPSGSSSSAPSGSNSTSESSDSSQSQSPSGPSSSAALPTGATSVTIPFGGRSSFGVPDSDRALLLTGLTRELFPADTVRIRFTFQKAGSVIANVPVQLATVPRTAIPAESGAEGEGG